MLGRAFKHELQRLVPEAIVYPTSKNSLNVGFASAFTAYDNFRPDFIIHCAALVDADYCENNQDEGRASIVVGSLNAINYAKRHKAFLFYPQSFLIYDGLEIIDEDTLPRPLSVYGQLKKEAELLVLDQLEGDSLSIRMGGFFGGEKYDKNFVGKFVPHLAKLIKEGVNEIDVGDRVWQPTYTQDLVVNSLLLLASKSSGIYCMASHDCTSFYQLALEIIHILGIGDKVHINRVDFSLKDIASRPYWAEMKNKRLQREGLDRQRNWVYSLSEYLSGPYFKGLFQ